MSYNYCIDLDDQEINLARENVHLKLLYANVNVATGATFERKEIQKKVAIINISVNAKSGPFALSIFLPSESHQEPISERNNVGRVS